MMGGDIGVEIGLRAINRDLSQQSYFGELVQGVVDRRERYRDFRARCLFVEHFGSQVPIAFAEQDPTQRHALTGWAQTNFTQHRLHVVPRATGDRRPIREVLGRLHVRNYQGTRWSHYRLNPKGRHQTEASKTRFICNIYAIDPSDATASQLPPRPVWRGFCAENLLCGSLSRHLCPLGLVCYQRGHGTSVKPTT